MSDVAGLWGILSAHSLHKRNGLSSCHRDHYLATSSSREPSSLWATRPPEQRRQVFLGVHQDQGLGPLRPPGHLRELPLELGDLPIASINRGRLAPALSRGKGRQLAA